MTRCIHIYCDGGFGNRFNGLVAGLLIAQAADLKPVVVWPLNNWCGASFTELFDAEAAVTENELLTYVPQKDKFQFFMTEDHLKMGVDNQSPLQTSTLEQAQSYLKSCDKDVFFHTPLIPGFLDLTAVKLMVNQLPIKAHIVSTARAFIADKGLTEFFGIHIRKTDFGNNGSDDENLFTLLSNCPQKKFFVCSDDAGVEARFSTLPNVSIYTKRAYVETLVDGDWNTLTADHSGRVYASNVTRSATSVEDAVIDLLILSYSQIVDTSKSTFRNSAMLLQAARHVTRLPTNENNMIEKVSAV
jgi:hypothetical protein